MLTPSFRGVRIALAAVLALLCCVPALDLVTSLDICQLRAQDSPPREGETPPLSASLLRRLASSADAFRTGEPIYIVASEEFPHDVVGAFPNEEVAQHEATVAGGGFHVYGPFETPMDMAGMEPLPLAVVPCFKDDITTRWTCPRALGARSPVFGWDELDSISVRFYPRGEPPVSLAFTVPWPSAIVFTMDAFDRFIVPYYTGLFGPEYVAGMRDSLEAYIRDGLAR